MGTSRLSNPSESIHRARGYSWPRARFSFHPIACAIGLLVAAWAMAGCVSLGGSESDELEMPGASAEGTVGPVEDEAKRVARFTRQLEEARAAAAQGDTARALAVCEEALSDRPPTEVRTELVALRRELREVAFEERIMSGSCRIEGDSFVVGEGVPVRLELSNRGSTPIEIPVAHRRRVESRSMFLLRVRCRDWDHQGSTVTQERSLMVPLDEAIRIPPFGTWDTVYMLETDDPFFRPERVVYRRLTVSARLQPVEIRAGELAWFAQVDLDPSTCELFPPGIEPVLDDPGGTLARAVEVARKSAAALNHVFFAGILFYREDPRATARLLLEALASDSLGLRQGALATLRLVTDQRDLVDAEDWEAWLLDRGVLRRGGCLASLSSACRR